MSFFIICCFLLTVAYAALMMVYRIGWKRQPAYHIPETFRPSTRISVIIPARNEAANIEACVWSVLKQDYPKELIQVVVIDDHSEDNTAALASILDVSVRVISLQEMLQPVEITQSYKKRALAAGIAHSSSELIVTTDADCLAGPEWLKSIAALYEQTGAAMIIGPVAFAASSKLLDVFQSLDFTTMQGITAAAYQLGLGSMANGANLAFSRTAFEVVNGYTGIDHLASGDDYLLLHKMSRHFPANIHYLKAQAAIIRTASQPNWSSFLQQRIRWASKSGKYPDARLTTILLLVYLFNVSLAAMLIASFWNVHYWIVLLAMLTVKTAAEIIFLLPVTHFFHKRHELVPFPLLQLPHIAYIVLAGFLGMMGSYHWKGRKVR